MAFVCAVSFVALCIAKGVSVQTFQNVTASAVAKGSGWEADVGASTDVETHLNPKRMAKACVHDSCLPYVVHCEKPTICEVRTGLVGVPDFTIRARSARAMDKAFASLAVQWTPAEPVPLSLFTARSDTVAVDCKFTTDPTSARVRDQDGKWLKAGGKLRMSGREPVPEAGCEYIAPDQDFIWDVPAPRPADRQAVVDRLFRPD